MHAEEKLETKESTLCSGVPVCTCVSMLATTNYQLNRVYGIVVLFSHVGNLKEFKEFLLTDEGTKGKIADLKKRVEEFASAFPLPGLEDI